MATLDDNHPWPLVSFLMPIATPAPFLAETLHSVVSQTESSWELIAVIDGPAGNVEDLLKRTVVPSKLRLMHTGSHRRGIGRALNLGLTQARGEFIARIDSDDLCAPNRLQAQVEAMREWPDVVVLGANARLINDKGVMVGSLRMRTGSDIARHLLVRNQLIHSAVMLRTSTVRQVGGYNPLVLHREDYELWLRMSVCGKVANLPDLLVDYRLSEGQLSRSEVPRSSKAYVKAARQAASEGRGLGSAQRKLTDWAWSLGQYRSVQRRVGRLRGRR